MGVRNNAKAVLERLEHQDSVSLAAPFAVPFLVDALSDEEVQHKLSLVRLLATLLKSALLTLDANDVGSEQVDQVRQLSLSDPFLVWSEFESDHGDDLLYEEAFGEEHWTTWHHLTVRAIAERRSTISQFVPENSVVADEVNTLLSLIDDSEVAAVWALPLKDRER